jgi:ABC-type transport system involved in multi-copper enzyme maturation permease subunit
MALSIDLAWLNPLWWVGPVLDKELRVLSRRKRTYWMKGLFPVLLGLMIVAGWFGAGRSGGVFSAAGSEQLSRVSRGVVSSMTWLQFVLSQCMAVLMMSHALHDEIRRRTLDVLMTTPIRPVQIVLGKLFGQLMMVWIVLALSFPVLAIIRVWGGVSWDYLVATSCVTVSSTLCVASFSLCLALWVKQAHQTILIVLTLLVVGYFAGSLGTQFNMIPGQWFSLVSSFTIFNALNASYNSASGPMRDLWIPHFVVMLAGSAVFALLCVVTLRHRILNTIRGTQNGPCFQGVTQRLFRIRQGKESRHIRRVKGEPVLWKELGCRSVRTYLVKAHLPWIILGSLCLVVSLSLSARWTQLFVSAITWVVMLRVGVMAALCVAREKESRAWTVLLCTPVPDIWLLRHKAMAVLIKNAAGWIPLLVYYVACLFMRPGDIQVGMLSLIRIFSLIATLYMVTGIGIYFSVRMKTGSVAITATLIAWVVWQLLVRFAFMIVIYGAQLMRGLPSMVMYWLIPAIMGVFVGAVMFKLAGRNLRKYAF